ncbi:hypothetical protein NE237_033134 [Protea cynaroides]|uniref:Uncharacterized protein n=1 Tax=Protea cynaroides TaxID=273540 RepID=A0A9Q0L4G7_9MAGN|nr:hypothetical protein NE237_033134 [Protea cynaroides]
MWLLLLTTEPSDHCWIFFNVAFSYTCKWVKPLPFGCPSVPLYNWVFWKICCFPDCSSIVSTSLLFHCLRWRPSLWFTTSNNWLQILILALWFMFIELIIKLLNGALTSPF